MKIQNSKTYFTAFFLFLLIIILPSSIFAQEVKKERGHNGRISKEKLLEVFKEGIGVSGYIIQGDDLIEIIKITNDDITIRNSIIEGGLDFTKLPKELLKNVQLLEHLSEEAKNTFLKIRVIEPKVHLVTNLIELVDSEIKPSSTKKVNVLGFGAGMSGWNTVSGVALDASNTIFLERMDFRGTLFNGLVFTSKVDSQDLTQDLRSVFSKGVTFSEVIFNDDAYLTGAIFNYHTDFKNTVFKGKSAFSGTTFELATFTNVKFKDNTYFRGAIFDSSAEFIEADFNGIANFEEATFRGSSSFGYSVFSGDADFSRSNFCRTAVFAYANFKKSAIFQGAQFHNLLSLPGVSFEGYTNFRKTHINRLNFRNNNQAIVRGRIDFRNATITDAHFQNIIFEKDIDFSDARFGFQQNSEEKGCLSDMQRPSFHALQSIMGSSSFKTIQAVIIRYVTFESDVYFIRTSFFGDISFERINYKNEANFKDAIFTDGSEKQRFSLSYVNAKNLLINWDQLPDTNLWLNDTQERVKSFLDFQDEASKKRDGITDIDIEEIEKLEPLSQVLKGLETNFLSQGKLDNANEIYYHMKIAELQKVRNDTRIWQIERLIKEAFALFHIVSGYGTKPIRTLFYSIVSILFFAAIYMVNGTIVRKDHPLTKEDLKFTIRPFESYKYYITSPELLGQSTKKNENKLINAIRLSFIILFRLGVRDTTISGKVFGCNYQTIVFIARCLGVYLIWSLLYTLYRTVPFANEIIKALL